LIKPERQAIELDAAATLPDYLVDTYS